MKHVENGDNKVVILTNKEIQIIGAALNNRMCYLGRMKESEEDIEWARIEWDKCLDLQCQWFEIE